MFKKIAFFLFVAGASLSFNKAAHSEPGCSIQCSQLRAICLDEGRSSASCRDNYNFCIENCRNGIFPDMPE